MAGTPPLIPPLTTDNPTPTPTGTGGSSPSGPATASGLYLYTFLATLLILLGISLAVILRATYRRRRMRIMIANGTWIPPNMNSSTEFIGEFADDDDEGADVPLRPGAFGAGAFGNGGWRAGGGGARGRGRGRRRERIWSVKPSLFDVMVVPEKEKDGFIGASRWSDFMPISATLIAPSPLHPNSNSNSEPPNTNPPQPAPIPIPPPVDRPTRTSMFTRTLFSSYGTRASAGVQHPLAMDVMTNNTNANMNTPGLPDTQSPAAAAAAAADRSIRVVFLVAMPSPTSPTSPYSTSSTKLKHNDNDNDTYESDSDEHDSVKEGEEKGDEGGDGEIPPMELGVVHLCLPPPAKTKTKVEMVEECV